MALMALAAAIGLPPEFDTNLNQVGRWTAKAAPVLLLDHGHPTRSEASMTTPNLGEKPRRARRSRESLCAKKV